MLQKCNQHQVDAKRVKALHFVYEARLVPRLEEEGQLDKAHIVLAVGTD